VTEHLVVLIRRLFGVRMCSLRKPLDDKLFQVFLEAPAVDSLVPLTVVVRTTLFYSEKCRFVSDWSRASDPRLVLDGVEDLVDGEPKQSEVLCWLEGLERT